MKITSTKERRLSVTGPDEYGLIYIVEEQRHKLTGFSMRRWDRVVIMLAPDELRKIAKACLVEER